MPPVFTSLLTLRAAEEEDSPYGYTPTRWVTILFLSLFTVSTIIHFAQAIRFRMWWVTWTIGLCGMLEIGAWAGRVWSSIDPENGDAFQLQIVAAIIGPTPFLAAVFIIFGRLIRLLGLSYSRFGPRVYTVVFVSCDVISLVVQGVGGGIAASGDTKDQAALGANIMLGGIVFQLVVITLFCIVYADYLVRYFKDSPYAGKTDKRGLFSGKICMMTWSLVFVITLLYIRAVYRIIELAGGWDGRVMVTEKYFNVLDGMMIAIAMYTVNMFHPGWLIREAWFPDALYNTVKGETVSMEQLNPAVQEST